MSKAWIYECYDSDDGVMAFFANTVNEAKMIALGWDAQYRRYIDIRVERVPSMDKLNRDNGYIMDWNKDTDRRAMLEIGLHCFSGEETPMDCCEECINVADCNSYQLYKESKDGETFKMSQMW